MHKNKTRKFVSELINLIGIIKYNYYLAYVEQTLSPHKMNIDEVAGNSRKTHSNKGSGSASEPSRIVQYRLSFISLAHSVTHPCAVLIVID